MSDYLEKPKRKVDQFDGPFNSALVYLGLRPTPIKLIVGAPLEMCMSRLQSKAQMQGYFGLLLSRVIIEVNMYQTDDEHCRFRVLRKQYRRNILEVTGYMEQLSQIETRITASVETQEFLTKITFPLIVMMLAVFIIFSLLVHIPFLFSLVIDFWVIGMLVAITLQVATDRQLFIRFIEETLIRPESVDVKKKEEPLDLTTATYRPTDFGYSADIEVNLPTMLP